MLVSEEWREKYWVKEEVGRGGRRDREGETGERRRRDTEQSVQSEEMEEKIDWAWYKHTGRDTEEESGGTRTDKGTSATAGQIA